MAVKAGLTKLIMLDIDVLSKYYDVKQKAEI